MTVNGPVAAGALGLALPHEHVMSTFGAEPERYPTYSVDRLLAQVLPYLARLKTLGVRALLDCTAAFFGRHPELLRRIARESEIYILTNTGYYGAANNRYVPPHVFHETSRQIAARWTREWQDGIDETGVRPGFIKTAIDAGPLTETAEKLLRAAALTHLRTGLTIQTHTGDNAPAALAMLDLLAQEGVHPSAWVWVHAHAAQDAGPLLDAARRGTWISLDGLSPASAATILARLQALKAAGLLENALLSHDGDSYQFDGAFRPYDYLLADFIPRLGEAGFTREEIDLVTVANPARAFTVRVREMRQRDAPGS
jgi:phosphotriesterase-related protein